MHWFGHGIHFVMLLSGGLDDLPFSIHVLLSLTVGLASGSSCCVTLFVTGRFQQEVTKNSFNQWSQPTAARKVSRIEIHVPTEAYIDNLPTTWIPVVQLIRNRSVTCVLTLWYLKNYQQHYTHSPLN